MDPLWLAAGAQALSGITSAFGASKQLSQRDAMQAQSAFNWEQHKRSLLEGPALEMKGLKRAGINPLYRYGQHGTPMSTSAQGVSQAPSVNRLQGLAEGLGNTVSSAVDAHAKMTTAEQQSALAKKTVEEIAEVIARVENIGATTDLTRAQRDHEIEKLQKTVADRMHVYLEDTLTRKKTDLTRVEIEREQAQIDAIRKNIQKMDIEIFIERWRKISVEARARTDLTTAQQDAYIMNSMVGFVLRFVDLAGQSVNPFSSVVDRHSP